MISIKKIRIAHQYIIWLIFLISEKNDNCSNLPEESKQPRSRIATLFSSLASPFKKVDSYVHFIAPLLHTLMKSDQTVVTNHFE